MSVSVEQSRFYKIKNPRNKFICSLCTAPRELKYNKNLSIFNYIQLAILTASTVYFSYGYIGVKSLLSLFLYWPIFELVNKFLYRRELPCPYCGFDAVWYKRDIKVAREKVEKFWENQQPTSNSPTILPEVQEAD